MAGVSCGVSCTTLLIRNLCRSPAGRLRRCGPPAPIARRCRRRSLAPPAPPARRGYGYVAGAPVVCGTALVPVRPCRFLRAAPPRRSLARQTGRRYGPAPPPARRGYGYVAGAPVVCGTAGVPVQVCQGSCAPVQVIGVARHAGRWYGSAPAPPARRGYGYVAGMPVVRGTAGVPVQVCQGSYAPVQAIGVARHAGRWYGSAPAPPARRGYGCRVSTPVVDGTGVGRA